MVGITIDAMETAHSVDKIILLSGDVDFALLIDKVKRKYGVITEVYGVVSLSADSLIASADRFHPITEEMLF